MAALTSRQARSLADVEENYSAAKRALEIAEEKRDEVRDRLRASVPVDEQLEVGGVRIKRIRKSTGRRFSLKAYAEKYKPTKRMLEFITERDYDAWFVTRVK